MISDDLIKQELLNTLDTTDLKLGKKYEGKVRDNYLLGKERIIVTTDRISAFDVVLGTIPFKGQVLDALSNFWFDKTKKIVKNHIVKIIDPNITLVKEVKPLPVEMVVRGYITGVTKTSAWYNYSQGVRNFCGNVLPEGLKKDQKFDKPILTPSTKAEKGDHDESVSPEQLIERTGMTKELYEKVADTSLKLFNFGVEVAAKQGIILVDTKYEFGLDEEGELVLMDEIHTPDSSRYWYADSYDELFSAGKEQKKIDKEYVRRWLANQGYTGDGVPPKLTDEVRVEAAKRYIDAYEKITGQEFKPSVGDPQTRIRKNLTKAKLL